MVAKCWKQNRKKDTELKLTSILALKEARAGEVIQC